jgi:hypothetical protein
VLGSLWYSLPVSYVLDPSIVDKLRAPVGDIDDAVVRVDVRMGLDHDGDDVVFFDVVLRDDAIPAEPSAAFGARLQRISAALRQRSSSMIPQAPFAHVRFRGESESSKVKRRSA